MNEVRHPRRQDPILQQVPGMRWRASSVFRCRTALALSAIELSASHSSSSGQWPVSTPSTSATAPSAEIWLPSRWRTRSGMPPLDSARASALAPSSPTYTHTSRFADAPATSKLRIRARGTPRTLFRLSSIVWSVVLGSSSSEITMSSASEMKSIRSVASPRTCHMRRVRRAPAV